VICSILEEVPWRYKIKIKFINGEKIHIAYGHCDGTKKYE
jgi:hypothetical protein